MSPEAQLSGTHADRPEVDREALLAALVLAPTTFARNRFFGLFKESWAAKVRGRAGQLRTIVRHLTDRAGADDATVVELAAEGERTRLRYAVRELHLVRTAFLEPLELALLRFALRTRKLGDPAAGGILRMSDDDRSLVEGALAKLGRELHTGGA